MTKIKTPASSLASCYKRTKKARPEPRFLLAAVLLDRDLLGVGLRDLRQRQLQHAVDMLGLRRVGVNRFRQTDRTARLAEGPLFPQRLAAGVDCIEELGADRDIAIFDVDFDLVLGNAGKLCLDDVGFRRFDDVERDGAT